MLPTRRHGISRLEAFRPAHWSYGVRPGRSRKKLEARLHSVMAAPGQRVSTNAAER